MKKKKTRFITRQVMPLLIIILLISCQSDNAGFKQFESRLFDSGWKFFKGDIPLAEQVNFDDSQWRNLTIPHDWGIEPHPIQDDMYIGPFVKGTKDSTSTGNIIGGTGWYRKYFTLEPTDKNKTIFLCFDGISVQSDVWINGRHAGFHPNGYTPFYYNITPYLNPDGEENLVAIKTVNTGDNSRWYTGAGLYRHIQLLASQHQYIEPWGVYITTPHVSGDEAQVNISISVRNDSDIASDLRINAAIYDKAGNLVASADHQETCQAKNNVNPLMSLSIDKPELWSPDSPGLYTAEIKLVADGSPADIKRTKFGIRSIEFSAEKGFLLNGKETLLKGACIHHDNGLLGAATFDRAEIRRVEILKKNGFNAIRTAHNLPSTPFLDACDSLGMLVIDEAFDMWIHPKRDNDYHLYFEEWSDRDIASMVLRDRNHPSVILWSIGNEIFERADSSGLAIAGRLVSKIKSLDDTRPVSQAICALWQVPSQPWDATIPAFALLDIGCYNYEWRKYERDHQLYPQRVMVGTESFPREAYDNWKIAVEKPYVIGDFVWTGMDYIGEVGIGNTRYGNSNEVPIPVRPWPWYLSWCGDIDICGNKKPQSYYRDVVWGESDLELLVHAPVPKGKIELVSKWGWPDEYPHWNWFGNENTPLQVSVYANFDTVRINCNGQFISEKAITKEDKHTATFMVPYQAGGLTAAGIRNGKEVISKTLTTAGIPAKINLVAERHTVRNNPNDLAYIQIEVTDRLRNLVPDAAIPLRISVSGEGKLIACGNAAPDDLVSFNNPDLKTFRGKALAILQPGTETGNMYLTVKAEGLPEAKVEVQISE